MKKNPKKNKVLILNGPNLNMLGTREPEIYGHHTLRDIEAMCRAAAGDLGLNITFRQSNHEGVLIDWVQDAVKKYQGIIINAGGYTHTSIALHDALKIFSGPIIEVHLSNPLKREKFRHHSYVEPLAAAVIRGKGAKGYVMALGRMRRLLDKL